MFKPSLIVHLQYQDIPGLFCSIHFRRFWSRTFTEKRDFCSSFIPKGRPSSSNTLNSSCSSIQNEERAEREPADTGVGCVLQQSLGLVLTSHQRQVLLQEYLKKLTPAVKASFDMSHSVKLHNCWATVGRPKPNRVSHERQTLFSAPTWSHVGKYSAGWAFLRRFLWN